MKCETCYGCENCIHEPYIIEHSFGQIFECSETGDSWIDTTFYTKPSINCPKNHIDDCSDKYAGGKL